MKKTGKRDQIVLATKVGKPMGEGKVGLAPAYIREAVDASLRRLKTDHIDLYQSHDDDAKTPQEESLGAFAELIQAGKVRAIGASNFSAPRLAEALDVFFDVRKVPGLKKKPSTSELVDWLKLLMADNIGEAVLRERDPTKAIPPLAGALVKNEQDVMLLERLAFMSRRGSR